MSYHSDQDILMQEYKDRIKAGGYKRASALLRAIKDDRLTHDQYISLCDYAISTGNGGVLNETEN